VVQSRDPLLLELLGDWLHRHPWVTAVVLAADGAELSRLCGPCRPDAVVIDTAPGQDTEFLLDWLRTVAGRAAVLLLASQGTVLRQRERERAVQVVLRADCLVTLADTLDRLGESAHAVAPRAAALLTARELDVLRLLSLGRRSPAIGAILGVSARTVENHKRRIFAKLDVHGETQAVAEAIRLGLLRHPPVRRPARLTPRESEIISLAAAGNSVKQTARALNISVKTVESIQSHLFSKLGVSGRTGAVAAVYGRGDAGPAPVT
jgi:DNA-binding NarL/FixJ family response regulator